GGQIGFFKSSGQYEVHDRGGHDQDKKKGSQLGGGLDQSSPAQIDDPLAYLHVEAHRQHDGQVKHHYAESHAHQAVGESPNHAGDQGKTDQDVERIQPGWHIPPLLLPDLHYLPLSGVREWSSRTRSMRAISSRRGSRDLTMKSCKSVRARHMTWS